MVGTFQSGDVLYLSTTRIPRVGDVVVFQSMNRTDPVVHRVMARLPGNRYRTRGDGNRCADGEIIEPVHITGVVIAKRSRRGLCRVHGGWSGNVRRRIVSSCLTVLRQCASCAAPFYNYLKRSDLPARILQPGITRILILIDGKPILKLRWRSRTVGTVDPQNGFQGKPPFELLVPSFLKQWNDREIPKQFY